MSWRSMDRAGGDVDRGRVLAWIRISSSSIVDSARAIVGGCLGAGRLQRTRAPSSRHTTSPPQTLGDGRTPQTNGLPDAGAQAGSRTATRSSRTTTVSSTLTTMPRHGRPTLSRTKTILLASSPVASSGNPPQPTNQSPLSLLRCLLAVRCAKRPCPWTRAPHWHSPISLLPALSPPLTFSPPSTPRQHTPSSHMALKPSRKAFSRRLARSSSLSPGTSIGLCGVRMGLMRFGRG